MVDYTKPTGTAGTLIIRDLGYQVQFHLNCSDPATNNSALPWSGRVNGSDVGGTVNYPAGAGMVHVASYDVATTQDVRFSIGATGTQGFGGPTDFIQRIDRATVPPAPAAPVFSNLSHTTAHIAFTENGNGGAPILERQIIYGTSPTLGGTTIGSDGSTDVDGLNQAVTYYAWARIRNEVGWSNWSARGQGRTLSSGRLKQADGTYREFVAYVKTATGYREAIPYVKDVAGYRASKG